MKIMEAIKRGMIELKNENIESPKMQSRLLMQFILNKPRQYIIVNDMEELNKADEEKYFNAIASSISLIGIKCLCLSISLTTSLKES